MEIKKLELFKIEMSMAIQILLKHTEHINESKMRLDFLTEQISRRVAGRSELWMELFSLRKGPSEDLWSKLQSRTVDYMI